MIASRSPNARRTASSPSSSQPATSRAHDTAGATTTRSTRRRPCPTSSPANETSASSSSYRPQAALRPVEVGLYQRSRGFFDGFEVERVPAGEPARARDRLDRPMASWMAWSGTPASPRLVAKMRCGRLTSNGRDPFITTAIDKKTHPSQPPKRRGARRPYETVRCYSPPSRLAKRLRADFAL